MLQPSGPIIPFLKWAGGKRWLLSRHPELFPLNSTFDRYVEPFLGGGAVFFGLRPERAILSDVNPELIETYEVVRDNWRDIDRLLRHHQNRHCQEYYYKQRSIRHISKIKRAAQFIYLNRTCWNGLYRVNLKGEFNVPIGTKNSVLLDTDSFENVSDSLQKAKLGCRDFSIALSNARSDDFVFVDPPYTVNHNMNGFLKYNEKIFHWSDQVRLREAVFKAKRRGVRILILNADHQSIRELYAGFGKMVRLSRNSVLAGNAEYRGKSTELAIMSEVFY